MTTEDMKIVTLHSWTPGEVCPGGIHEFNRSRTDYFTKDLECCKHCAAVRHYEWWNNDVEFVDSRSGRREGYEGFMMPDSTVEFRITTRL